MLSRLIGNWHWIAIVALTGVMLLSQFEMVKARADLKAEQQASEVLRGKLDTATAFNKSNVDLIETMSRDYIKAEQINREAYRRNSVMDSELEKALSDAKEIIDDDSNKQFVQGLGEGSEISCSCNERIDDGVRERMQQFYPDRPRTDNTD